MNLIVLGSRIFEPISLVDAEISALPADATVTGFGSADVCKRAVKAAESRGLDARNVVLSQSRRELIEAARLDGAAIVIFTAIDPVTKHITQGTQQLIDFLAAADVQARQVASPLPGKVCALMTKQRQSVDRAIESRHLLHRRRYFIAKALEATTALLNARDGYERKLEAGMWVQADDEAATEKWLRWLVIYEQLSKAIEDARAVLAEPAVAA